MATQPKYPIYIPSKGRPDSCFTARCFVKHETPFYLVIEEAEREAYAAKFDEKHILVLPFSDQGSVIPARNWIMDHAIALGAERHWQFDDNIRMFRRYYKGGLRIPIQSGLAVRLVEDFTDRYTNVAISGFNYTMFVVKQSTPFTTNCHVYSATLINNSIPHRWRGKYNEDTDMCLQVLADGWCTILMHAFMVDKEKTMLNSGGNSAMYEGDGRLKMARSLERQWHGTVTVNRKFQRPQHIVSSAWKKFDTKLIRRTDIEWPEGTDNYGMKLKAQKEIKSPRMRRMYEAEKAE